MKPLVTIFKFVISILLLSLLSCSGGSSSSSSTQTATDQSSIHSCVLDVVYYDESGDIALCTEDFSENECLSLSGSDAETSSTAAYLVGSCQNLAFSADSQFEIDGVSWYVMNGLYGIADTEEKNPLFTQTVDSSGAVVSSSGVTIVVPPNATSTAHDISIAKESNGDGFDTYTLYGLRDFLSKSIEVSLKIPDGVDASSLEVQYSIEDGCYSKSLDSMVECRTILEGVVEGENLKVTLPAAIDTTAAFAPKLASSTDTSVMQKWLDAPDVEKVKLLLKAYKKESEHFVVHAPSLSLQKDVDNEIVPALEYAYTLLGKDFDLSDIPNPLHVYLQSPDYFNGLSDGVDAIATTLPFFDSYINVKLDAVTSMSQKSLWATLGHEFFHIVQREYLPYFSTEKYMSEAASTWFEVDMSKDKLFTGTNQVAYSNFENYGLDSNFFDKDAVWNNGNEVNSLSRLGYGAATFIQYMNIVSGVNTTRPIFDNLKEGKTAIEALKNTVNLYVTGYSLESLWKEFAIAYNTDFVQSPYNDSAGWPKPLANANVNIAVTNSYSKQFKMMPFSAQYISINNGSETESHKVKIKVTNKEIYQDNTQIYAYLYDLLGNKITSLSFDGSEYEFSLDDKTTKRDSYRRLLFMNAGETSVNVALNIESSAELSNKALSVEYDTFYYVNWSANFPLTPVAQENSTEHGGTFLFTEDNGDEVSISFTTALDLGSLTTASVEGDEVGELSVNISYSCQNPTNSSGLCSSKTIRMDIRGVEKYTSKGVSIVYTAEDERIENTVVPKDSVKTFNFKLYRSDLELTDLETDGVIEVGGDIMMPTNFQSGFKVEYTWSR